MQLFCGASHPSGKSNLCLNQDFFFSACDLTPSNYNDYHFLQALSDPLTLVLLSRTPCERTPDLSPPPGPPVLCALFLSVSPHLCCGQISIHQTEEALPPSRASHQKPSSGTGCTHKHISARVCLSDTEARVATYLYVLPLYDLGFTLWKFD